MRAVREQGGVKRAVLAPWALRLALFAVALIFAGMAGHRVFAMATPVALNLVLVAFVLAGVAILFGALALISIWRTGLRGSGASGGGVLIGLAILAWPLSLLPTVLTTAPLNDVTTDFETPPALSQAQDLRGPGALPVAYDAERNRPTQQAQYPDIQPIVVDRPAAETFDIVLQAIRRLDYRVVGETEPGTNQTGLVEAVSRTLIFGFRDDVAVRIVGRGGRSRIDVRSASRFGEHDFGANASRVRRVIREILAQLRASVPARERG